MNANDIQCPLCVNIQRLNDYLLAPDEVVFFDWMVVKQSRVFKFNWFYYSAERIEWETRIKRRCLERIIKRFTAMGILKAEIHAKPNDDTAHGRARYFYVVFSEIIRRLPEIIDARSESAQLFKSYFEMLEQMRINQFHCKS